MFRLKVRRVGNSLGLTLPAELTHLLRVREGDTLLLTETTDGFRVSAQDPEFEAAMAAAEGFMAQYRNALRALSR
jgi:putative addiction module antidote